MTGSMELTMPTNEFQGLVSQALKGTSNDAMVAITSLIAIEVKNGTLALTTTDSVNYVKVIKEGVSASDFYVCLSADQFGKLISKITSETTTLILQTDESGKPLFLQIKAGTGTYKLPLPIEEDGLIRYEMPLVQDGISGKINLTSVRSILEVNKSSLLNVFLGESKKQLMGYYCGDEVVTSDGTKISMSNIKLFEQPILLRSRLMDLLLLFKDEEINYSRANGKITFSSPGLVITTSELEGIEQFPIQKIKPHLTMSFPSKAVVSNKEISSLIDRLMLFVTMEDKNLVYITFNNNGMYISTKQSNGAEMIAYKNSVNFQAYNICLDIQMLKTIIDSQSTDLIDFEYGIEGALKVVGTNSIQLLSLAPDDRIVASQPQQEMAAV